MAMMYLTVITIYRLTGTGPLWDIVAKTMRDPCKQYWWSFFLYIQNYYNYDDLVSLQLLSTFWMISCCAVHDPHLVPLG
jgi:uncharacterized membrane protein YhaH (DUF805 family)